MVRRQREICMIVWHSIKNEKGVCNTPYIYIYINSQNNKMVCQSLWNRCRWLFYAMHACVWEAARVSPTLCNLQTLQDRVTDGLCEPMAADEGEGTTCSVRPSPPPLPPPQQIIRPACVWFSNRLRLQRSPPNLSPWKTDAVTRMTTASRKSVRNPEVNWWYVDDITVVPSRAMTLSLRGVWTIRLQGPEGKGGGAGEVMRIASLLFWLDRRYRWERFLLSIIEHIME